MLANNPKLDRQAGMDQGPFPTDHESETPPIIPFQRVIQALDALHVHQLTNGCLPDLVSKPFLTVSMGPDDATRVARILRQWRVVDAQTGMPLPILAKLANPLSRPRALAAVLLDYYGPVVVSELLQDQDDVDVRKLVNSFPPQFRLSTSLTLRAGRFVRMMFDAADASYLATALSPASSHAPNATVGEGGMHLITAVMTEYPDSHPGAHSGEAGHKGGAFLHYLDQLLQQLPDGYLWTHEESRSVFKQRIMALATRICDLADAIPCLDDRVEVASLSPEEE